LAVLPTAMATTFSLSFDLLLITEAARSRLVGIDLFCEEFKTLIDLRENDF
jgi:hypothetical protein